MGGGPFSRCKHLSEFWELQTHLFSTENIFYWNNKMNIIVLDEGMLLQPPPPQHIFFLIWMSKCQNFEWVPPPSPQFSKTMLLPTKNSVLMKSYINIKCFIHESSTENYILLHSYLQQLEKNYKNLTK